MERSAFRTRARTVEHLGREQVADCPTAISELWKNAFDAYATEVSLDIFDGPKPVAVVTDDGHGMSREDFHDQWLVIGTENKATSERVPRVDWVNQQWRVRQGQKGIGRLSCANLGPTLLLISRRRRRPYIASLVDWRLFENPFLNLDDIFIPTIEAGSLDAVFDQLPAMKSALIENIVPDEGNFDMTQIENAIRIRSKWRKFDKLPEDVRGFDSRAVANSLRGTGFSIEHLENWKGLTDHGTALMVSGINYDLQSQLAKKPFMQSTALARRNFRETLASFVDPYVDPDDPSLPDFHSGFTYRVRVWRNGVADEVIDRDRNISRRQVSGMEHCITGTVDEEGAFNGRVKVFGKWLSDSVELLPASDVRLPRRADSRLGRFDLFIATIEFDYRKSTHDKPDHERYLDLARNFSGFMIFRDGLRVLPYGRSTNDFFEIDDRRSRHAGREFWNHRQMFGRIAITRDENPNLRDKAGREGIIDNRAAKALKDIVIGLLTQSARKYFGTNSPIRKNVLPDVEASKGRQRDEEERRKLRERNKRTFKRSLDEGLVKLPELLEDLMECAGGIPIRSDADVASARETVARLGERLPQATIPGAPRAMSPRQRESYSAYRVQAARARGLHASIAQDVSGRIEDFRPTDPLSVIEAQFQKSRLRIARKVEERRNAAKSLLAEEFQRITGLAEKRKSAFREEAEAVLHLVKAQRVTFTAATRKLSNIDQEISEQNEAIFEPYLRALESLKESIDLEHLATRGLEDLANARADLDRLNSLAQLGIAVEITAHDLQDYDDIIAAGLKRLPEELADTKAVQDIRLGYEGLTDQFRFLSPLRLAGNRVERWVGGKEIHDYVAEFFGPTLMRNRIRLEASSRFLGMRVFDQPSRLLPVFINLVNNSVYWLGTGDSWDRRIAFCVRGKRVVVADSGPGVAEEDRENLFRLFFTRKIHGGRGVGLYLSKANLVAGGHSISYALEDGDRVLKGANFLIDFNGAEFPDA